MKKPSLLLILIVLLSGTTLQAQNPYESLGVEVDVLTLSKGKYKEFHPNDTIVQIGTVLLNTITGEVVAFIDTDTMYSEATLKPEIVSRWMSPDPLADEFPSWSPYNFAVDNPIRFIDPDGLAPMDPNCPGCPPPSSGSYLVHGYRQGFVDESLAYFTGMWEGAKTVLGFSEANDVSVLATGQNIDGSQASGFEYATAGVGLFLPVSGKTITKLSGKGSEVLEGFVKKITNQSEHLTDLDVAGAIRDIQGNPVIRSSDGHVYDHLGEVNDALKGVGNQLSKLNRAIDSGDLTGDVLKEAQRLRSDVQVQKDNIQNMLNKAINELKDTY